MRCINCHQVMECITAIHPVPGQPGKQRMDLHCVFPNENGGKGCSYSSHIGVIVEDSKEWICHEYNIYFKYNNKIFFLRGYDNLVDPYHQHRPNRKFTYISKVNNKLHFKMYDFIPISTGDDMHVEARKLFEKFMNMSAFY